jgi:hypothetical protein
MLRNKIMTFISILALLVPNLSFAKQSGGQDDYACVYAKVGIGFVATAEWFAGDKLIRSDQIPVWQWQCMPAGKGVDSVKISGLGVSAGGNNAVKGGIAAAAGLGVVAVAACGLTLGIGCIVEAGLATGAASFAAGAGAANALSTHIPKAKGWAVQIPLVKNDFTSDLYKGPHHYRGPQYIEIWGSIWNPQFYLNNTRCNGCM